MPKVHLTDLAVRTLKPPPTGQVTYTDEGLSGFGVRVSPGGTKTFVLVYGHRRRRVSLGRYPTTSLADARRKARELLAKFHLEGEEAVSDMTFAEGLESFLKLHCKQKNKESTYRETKRLLERHANPKLASKRLAEVKTQDLARLVDSILETPSEANHLHTALKTMFNWCRRRAYISANPMEPLLKPAKVNSRTRVLSDSELATVIRYSKDRGSFGQLVRMLILTGQRPGQIANLKAEYVDAQSRTITFPAAAMKSNREHTVPFGRVAASILDELPTSGYVFATDGDPEVPFNNWSTGKKLLDRVCGLPHWTLHDLRRTFATNLARLAIPPHITERILAHSGGAISGVAAIYNRYSYLDEMRDAINRYERFLVELD